MYTLLVDCPTQLTLMTWICQLCSMTNTSEKYERTQQGNLLTQYAQYAHSVVIILAQRSTDNRHEKQHLFLLAPKASEASMGAFYF